MPSKIFLLTIILLSSYVIIIPIFDIQAAPFQSNNSGGYLEESSIKLKFNIELLCQVCIPEPLTRYYYKYSKKDFNKIL